MAMPRLSWPCGAYSSGRPKLKRLRISCAVVLTSAMPVLLSAQPTRTLRSDLVGTWRLVAARQRMADGSVRPDPQTGPRGVGYIMYDATGHVCVVLANPDRPAWKATSPTEAEARPSRAWSRIAGRMR